MARCMAPPDGCEYVILSNLLKQAICDTKLFSVFVCVGQECRIGYLLGCIHIPRHVPLMCSRDYFAPNSYQPGPLRNMDDGSCCPVQCYSVDESGKECGIKLIINSYD